MQTKYLVYVFKGEIRVKECIGNEVSKILTLKENPQKYYTKIPGKEKTYQYGKLWCYNKSDIPYCIAVIKRHYQDRLATLEHQAELSKKIAE